MRGEHSRTSVKRIDTAPRRQWLLPVTYLVTTIACGSPPDPVRKIAPALAAGCTIVVKPAPETPLTMLLLGEILRDAGLPRGVLSILPTSSAAALVDPMLADDRLRKLTFTGSTGGGKALLAKAADRVLRTSMELGGNAPFLVFADADLEAAVDGAMAAKMRNTGQACTAANRINVENSIRGEFTEKLTARMQALTNGPRRSRRHPGWPADHRATPGSRRRTRPGRGGHRRHSHDRWRVWPRRRLLL